MKLIHQWKLETLTLVNKDKIMITRNDKEQEFNKHMSGRVRWKNDIEIETFPAISLNAFLDICEVSVAEPILVQRHKTTRSTKGIGSFMTDLFNEGSRKPSMHVISLEEQKKKFEISIEILNARIHKLSKQGVESVKNQLKGATIRLESIQRKLEVVDAHLADLKENHIVDGQHFSGMVYDNLHPESDLSFDGFECNVRIDGQEYNFDRKRYFNMKNMLESENSSDRIFAQTLLYGYKPFSITKVSSESSEALTRYFSGLNDGVPVDETVRFFRSNSHSIVDQFQSMVLEPLSDDSKCPNKIFDTYGESIGKCVSDFYRELRLGYQYRDANGKPIQIEGKPHKTEQTRASWSEPESGTLAMLLNVSFATMPNGFNRPIEVDTHAGYMTPMYTKTKKILGEYEDDIFMKDESFENLQNMIGGYAVANVNSAQTRGGVVGLIAFSSFAELLLKSIQKPTTNTEEGITIKDRHWCATVKDLDAWQELASEFIYWSDNKLVETQYQKWEESEAIPPNFVAGDIKLDDKNKKMLTTDAYYCYCTYPNKIESRTYRYKIIWDEFIVPNMERWERDGLISDVYEKHPTFGKKVSYLYTKKI